MKKRAMFLMNFKLQVWLVFVLRVMSVMGVCSVEHCIDPSRCILSRDQRSCKCATGYYSDQCDKDAHIKVMCGKDYIAIRVLEDFFKYYNVPLESLHLPNNSCRAQREVIDGIPYYMSRISKDKYLICGGKPLAKNLTHVSYSLSLQSDPQETNKTIIRQPIIRMEYTCIYPYVRTVSLPFPVLPLSSETVMRVEEHDVTIQMQLYTDHTYTESYTAAPTIGLGDKVYVEVAEPADFFLVRLNDCWSTQSSKPTDTDGLVHYLIRNGCMSDHSVAFNVTSGSSTNGESSTIRFNFNMFRFAVEPHDIYLHCTVQLCDPDDNASCKPICNSISKRAAVMLDPTQGLLSYGPIRVMPPQKPQSNILMTVVLPVAGVWILGFFLLILIIVAREGSRRLTQINKH